MDDTAIISKINFLCKKSEQVDLLLVYLWGEVKTKMYSMADFIK